MKVVVACCCLLALLAGQVFGQSAPAPAQLTQLDLDTVNLALNLEYLEAEFYSCAANGVGIPDELRGGGPASTGCEKGAYGDETQAIASEFAKNEIDHVRYLRGVLGSSAAPIPQLNVGTAFADAANLVYNMTLDPPYSPYDNDLDFYSGAFLFEDVGVTAYNGAIHYYLSAALKPSAAQILAVEGYHAGIIRTVLYEARDNTTDTGITVEESIMDFGLLREKVGAGAGQGLELNGGANLVATDANGLTFERVPNQIYDILTLGTYPAGGGWFPNGLSGISATAFQ